jgi:predicted DNA-binding transcriptional regulator AlpA
MEKVMSSKVIDLPPAGTFAGFMSPPKGSFGELLTLAETGKHAGADRLWVRKHRVALDFPDPFRRWGQLYWAKNEVDAWMLKQARNKLLSN